MSALPTLNLQKPPRSCDDELRRPELGAVVTGMDELLSDVGFKVDQLSWESLPVELPNDELFALVVYTYDNQAGEHDGNLYYELNKSLRERSAQGRTRRCCSCGVASCTTSSRASPSCPTPRVSCIAATRTRTRWRSSTEWAS